MKSRLRLMAYGAIGLLGVFLLVMVAGLSRLHLSQETSNKKETAARALLEIKAAAISTIMLDPSLAETNIVFTDAERAIQQQSEMILSVERNPQLRGELQQTIRQWQQYDRSSRTLILHATLHPEEAMDGVVSLYQASFKPFQAKVEQLSQRFIAQAEQANIASEANARLVYWILFPLLILICLVVAVLMIVLQRNEARTRVILDTAVDAIIQIDEHGRVMEINQACEGMFGYSRQELLGANIKLLMPEPYHNQHDDYQTGKAKVIWSSRETYARRKDGTVFPVEIAVGEAQVGKKRIFIGILKDITTRKFADQELRIAAIAFETQEGIIIANAETRIIRVNNAFCAITGYSFGDVIGQKASLLKSGNQKDEFYAEMHRILATVGYWEGELSTRKKNGDLFHVWLTITAVKDEYGVTTNYVGTVADISERKRTEEALREQEAFFRMIAENGEDFIAVLDLEGRRLYNNRAYTKLFGNIEALKGTDSFAEIHQDDRERIQQVFKETVQTGIGHRTDFRFVLPNGSIRYIESCGGLIKNSQGAASCVVVVSHDITERKQAEDEINSLAFYDPLTNLPNRRLFNDRLGQTMAANKRSNCFGALLFLDLDNFKPLNDVHGHSVGDLLLIEVANRLKSCVREMDTVARLGGDEFVVMLSELDVDQTKSTTQASIVAEKIRVTLAEPYRLTIKHDGQPDTPVEHHCTASIGVTLFFNHEYSEDDVLKWADAAMYQAKEAGRNSIRFYEPKPD